MNTAGRHLIGLELKVSVLHPEVEQRRVAFFDALLQQRNLLQQLQHMASRTAGDVLVTATTAWRHVELEKQPTNLDVCAGAEAVDTAGVDGAQYSPRHRPLLADSTCTNSTER